MYFNAYFQQFCFQWIIWQRLPEIKIFDDMKNISRLIIICRLRFVKNEKAFIYRVFFFDTFLIKQYNNYMIRSDLPGS